LKQIVHKKRKRGKNLRPYKAGVDDDNKIVLYNHAKLIDLLGGIVQEQINWE
jgi:hypothetical protein